MLPLSCSSTTFHWWLADIWRMYGACFALVTLTYHWQKFYCSIHARFIRNWWVLVCRLCVIFRWTFFVHNHVFAVWGLCMHLRWSAWFVWFVRYISVFFGCHSSVIFHRINKWKWSIFSTDKHAQLNLMRNSCVSVLVGLCDLAFTSYELLKTWNRVKCWSGEHQRTATEVPRQKNWWNAQIADVSRKTRNLWAIHAFTRLLGSVTDDLKFCNLLRSCSKFKKKIILFRVSLLLLFCLVGFFFFIVCFVFWGFFFGGGCFVVCVCVFCFFVCSFVCLLAFIVFILFWYFIFLRGEWRTNQSAYTPHTLLNNTKVNNFN
jgi:hypothetical protein